MCGMGREIPGSFLERGDGRTWDEMVDRDQPFSADDDDYLDDEDYADEEDADPITVDDWLDGWGEPTTADTGRRLFVELDQRIAELAERLYYRDMAAAAGDVVDAVTTADDKVQHADLIEFRRQHPDPHGQDEDPVSEPLVAPPDPPPSPTRPSPVGLLEAAIKEKLTPTEMLHWQEVLKGTRQQAIAEKLGISQGAVSKRERAIRERIDAIAVETIGRPYPERLVDRGLWARQGRRRNKRAPRQR